jgi:hypothetical protein
MVVKTVAAMRMELYMLGWVLSSLNAIHHFTVLQFETSQALASTPKVLSEEVATLLREGTVG